MWKAFINSVFRFESLRIGVLLLVSGFFGLLQYFHVLPESFFTSRTYGFIQFFLYIIISFLIIYTIYKYHQKKNMELLQKDIEELTKGIPNSAETTNKTTK